MEIAVRNVAMLADIGINPDEIGRSQTLLVDVVLILDRLPGDEIGATVDYRDIVRAAEELGTRHIALIETFATRLAESLLRHPLVRTITVTVSKPAALASGSASARIRLTRPTRETGLSLPGERDHSDAVRPA